MPVDSVAIIGASLAGTALALSLHAQGTPSIKLYESRQPDAPELASGVVLTPNGLAVLDKLGVLQRIASRCWKSQFNTTRNDREELVSKAVVATPERNGYYNHRLWRWVLLQEMRDMLAERGVVVEYGVKFTSVVREDDEGVEFTVQNADGTGRRVERADLLVGADGIYSTVRKYLTDVRPVYTGTLGVIAHIQRSDVSWPADYEPAVTIQGRPGAIFMIPEDADASEAMVGTQATHPDQSREEWERMGKDEEFMLSFFTRGYEEWREGSTARKVVDALRRSEGARKSLYLWPYLSMPRIDSWCSERTGRVLIVGDAAHALPPSSGQGVNQALEDVWSLSLLLKKSSKGLQETLRFWQDLRQERVDGIMYFATNATNVQRMPEKERLERERTSKTDGKRDMSHINRDWIYKHGMDEKIEEWVKADTAE